MNSELSQKIYAKLLSFLAYTARTEYEVRERIRRYLKNLDVSREEKQLLEDQLVDDLKVIKLVDDESYVSQVIAQKLASQKPESKFSIQQFLLKRGIKREAIGNKLSSYTNELEYEKAQQSALRKLLVLKAPDKRLLKQKLMKYLQSKRFSLDTIRSVVDSINELK